MLLVPRHRPRSSSAALTRALLLLPMPLEPGCLRLNDDWDSELIRGNQHPKYLLEICLTGRVAKRIETVVEVARHYLTHVGECNPGV